LNPKEYFIEDVDLNTIKKLNTKEYFIEDVDLNTEYFIEDVDLNTIVFKSVFHRKYGMGLASTHAQVIG